MLKSLVCIAIASLLAAATSSAAADKDRAAVIYDGVPTEVTASSEASKDLWITMDDLKRATRFVVKPQGVCRDELCFPLPAKRKAEFISKRGAVTWFNLTAFAALVKQPVARDEKNGVWYFGKREDERGTYLASLEAPNFSLPDINGKMHSLADYRGKKVLLVTWASW
jgi:AhpC/TSA family